MNFEKLEETEDVKILMDAMKKEKVMNHEWFFAMTCRTAAVKGYEVPAT